MKRISVNSLVRSVILAAAIVPIQIQSTSLTTARAVSNNQSKFQKQIKQSSFNQPFEIHAMTDKILSEQYTAKGKADVEAAAKKNAAEKAAQQSAASKAAQAKAAENESSQQASGQQATYTDTSYQTSSSSSSTANSSSASTTATTSSSDSYGISDPSKAWIESVESGGDANASNGQYQGAFQLSSQVAAEYGGYSGSAADKYVAARYGSWAAAAAHHREYGWY
ncbi:aggregation-promoting factor C-terminal-like domain-containing protein [Oenococcus oeni]